MAEGFRNIVIAFLLVGLFMFSLISFGVELAADNEINQTILSHPTINSSYQKIESNLSTAASTASGQRANFETEIPTESFGSLLFYSIVSAGKVFGGMMASMYNLITGSFSEVLGVSPIVLGTITAIILMSMVLLAWRVYKSGE